MKRLVRIAAGAAVVLVLACAGFGYWTRDELRRSLPIHDGRIELSGLVAEVTIERDSLGVPLIRGASREDVTRALGFVHAQERFFQMDGTRRSASGELAALAGPALLAADRDVRIHHFRALARRGLASLPPGDRALLEAYTGGVNEGLARLGRPPFEYRLLGVRPEPWKPEDSLLAIYAMFLKLHDTEAKIENTLGIVHDVMPAELADFLAPRGTEWDAPLEGGPFATPAIPGPEVWDLRRAPRAAAARSDEQEAAPHDVPLRGSNCWAVAGWRAAHGSAMLANDMHLDLTVPNIWYRAALAWPADGCGCDEAHLVVGVTLPGAPAVAAGSTRQVAWGFTNSYADWIDLVVLDEPPGQPDRYLTPEGPRPYEETLEIIPVKGAPADTLRVLTTIWGPVVGRDHLGRRRALRWTAHDAEAVDLRILELEHARGVDDALDIASRTGIPPQNFICADREGRIGWTIIGRIPRRVGFDGRLPVSWAGGRCRWEGWIAPAEVPRIVDPPSGCLWTANARVTAGEHLAMLGDGGYMLGARARQIRDDLAALDRPEESDLLAVQLDDRALLLERWHTLLLELLAEPDAVAGHPERAEFRRLVETTWSGRASVESQGYRLVRSFRYALLDRVYRSLLAPCFDAAEGFSPRDIRQWEGPLWKLATERPPHLLDPAFGSWEAMMLDAVDAAIRGLTENAGSLATCTWGRRNRTAIRHPLSAGIPGMGRMLDMPPRELPGDEHMPRYQTPDDGASERMVVSPARLEHGIFQMPGGESGHPLSPHYRAGHALWEEGIAAPLLPCIPVHQLVLAPAR